jgi:hypothetical protein
MQGLRGWSVFPEGWSWPKLSPAPLARWVPLVVLGLIGLLAFPWLERRSRRTSPWLALASLVAFAYALQFGALWVKSSNPEQLLLDRIMDVDFTGYLQSALHTPSISAFFGDYPETIHGSDWCNHCRTHPPGPVLIYWLAIRGAESVPPAWQETILQALPVGPYADLPPAAVLAGAGVAHMIPLAAALMVLPLYGLARQLASPERAVGLAALGAVVPAVVLMSPEFDQFYGALSAVLLYVVITGLRQTHGFLLWGVGAGVLLTFGIFWSLGLLVLAGPAVVLALAAVFGLVPLPVSPGLEKLQPRRLPLSAASAWLLGFGAGALLPWFVAGMTGLFHPLTVLGEIRYAQFGGITAMRPFGPWAVVNLIDFFQFLGLPLAITALLVLVRGRHAHLNLFAFLFWGVVLFLEVSGATRAEVGRLWIPIVPLALTSLYYAAGHGGLSASGVRALLASQYAICVVIAGNWLTP